MLFLCRTPTYIIVLVYLGRVGSVIRSREGCLGRIKSTLKSAGHWTLLKRTRADAGLVKYLKLHICIEISAVKVSSLSTVRLYLYQARTWMSQRLPMHTDRYWDNWGVSLHSTIITVPFLMEILTSALYWMDWTHEIRSDIFGSRWDFNSPENSGVL